MDYEKAYKEALERAKGLIEGTREDKCDIMEEDIINIFPELKESEDERIQKWLIKYFNKANFNGILEYVNNIKAEDIISWLEKQGEQKPVWSEEDERMFDSIIEDVMPYGECPDYPTDEEREYFYEGGRKVKWLKSLKERINNQKQ